MIKMRFSYSGFLCLFLSITLLVIPRIQGARVEAQTPPPAPSSSSDTSAVALAQNSQANGAQGLQVDGGYFFDQHTQSNSAYYYSILFQGNSLSEKKEPLSETTYPSATPAPPAGDSPLFNFHLENGVGKSNGSLADLLNITPLNLGAHSFLGELRGAIDVSASNNNKDLNVAIGVETPPVAPLAVFGGSSFASNWLVFGLQEGSQSSSSSPNSNQGNEVSIVTYRTFIGKGGGYVHSDNQRHARLLYTDAYFAQNGPYYTALRDNLLTKDTDSSNVHFRDLVVDAPLFRIELSSDESPGFWEIDPPAFLATYVKSRNQTGDYAMNKLKDYIETAPSNPIPPTFPLAAQEEVLGYINSPQPQYTSSIGASLIKLLNYWLYHGWFADVSDAGVVTALQASSTIPQDIKDHGSLVDISKLKLTSTQTYLDEAKDGDRYYANRQLLAIEFPTSVRALSTSYTPTSNDVLQRLWFARLGKYVESSFSLPDAPTYTVWLQDNGQYRFAGNAAGPKYTNILAATFTLYFNPAAEKRQWFRVHYENGLDRAAPTQYRNFIAVSLGTEF